MDPQTIFAIAGIAVTVILGIWAIVINMRYNKNVQITYAHELAIALTDDITQNFPNLKVLFHNQPVSDNLVLLKGYFINTGKKDISREMIEKQITMKLPNDFEWVECKVVEHSPTLKATANMTGKTEISFDTGLWKMREYLKVEALAKVPVVKADPDNLPKDYPTRRLLNALTFPHRITDSKTVHLTNVHRPSQTYQLRFFSFLRPFSLISYSNIMMAIMILFLGVWVLYSVHNHPRNIIAYRFSIDGQERVMSVKDVNDKVVLLEDKQGFKKEFLLSEFDNFLGKHLVVIHEKSRTIAGITFSLLCIGFGLFALLIFCWKGIRDYRLIEMITSVVRPTLLYIY
jgi:hypothetical protein